METIKLIKKFAPIFIFHSNERYYPVNLKTAEKEEFKENTGPEEPLYYTIIKNTNDTMVVNYILLFPVTYRGLLGISSLKGDVKIVKLEIDTKKKTLQKIYFGNNLIQEFNLKTTRPRIYVSLETHNFYPTKFTQKNIFGYATEETNEGLSWETESTQIYPFKKLSDKRYGDTKYVPYNFHRTLI